MKLLEPKIRKCKKLLELRTRSYLKLLDPKISDFWLKYKKLLEPKIGNFWLKYKKLLEQKLINFKQPLWKKWRTENKGFCQKLKGNSK